MSSSHMSLDSADVERSAMSVTDEPIQRFNSRMSGTSKRTSKDFEKLAIWGTNDDEIIDLARKETRNTLKSCDLREYQEPSVIDVAAKDIVPDDGHEFEEIDPELVTWEGDDDPGNPRNWKKSRKYFASNMSALLTLIPPMTSSVVSPAIPRILEQYHNSNQTVGTLMVGIILLGWGFFVLIVAPFSEVFGRKRVLLASAAGSAAFDLACAWSPNTACMLVFRAIEGAFSAAPMAVGAGVLADLFNDEERSWPLAFWGLSPSFGPVIAPVISGFIAEYGDWRWVFWSIAILQAAVGIIALFFFEETYAPFLLAQKRSRLQKETGNMGLHTIWEVTQTSFLVRIRNAVVRPVLFLGNPIVAGLGVALAFMYFEMYLLLVEYTNLWTERYHFSVGISGVMYVGFGLGILVGTFVWTPIFNRFLRVRRQSGKGRPEDKLIFLVAAAIEIAIGWFWYGWSAEARIHWIMPELGVAIFGGGIYLTFQAVQLYVVELNPRLASSAIASLVLGRCLVGATFPLFGHAMFNTLGYGWTGTMLALLMLFLGVPFPIVLYKYGARMRKWADERIVIN